MRVFRVFAGDDGESHIEELDVKLQPELGAIQNLKEVKFQHFPEPRNMDFHPLPDRRLIIHLTGEVEIGVSDGAKQIFRAGDARLIEDVTGRGHTHRDLTPTTDAAIYFL